MKHYEITPSTFYLYLLPGCITSARTDMLLNHLQRLESVILNEIRLASLFEVEKQSYVASLYERLDETRQYLKEVESKRELDRK